MRMWVAKPYLLSRLEWYKHQPYASFCGYTRSGKFTAFSKWSYCNWWTFRYSNFRFCGSILQDTMSSWWVIDNSWKLWTTPWQTRLAAICSQQKRLHASTGQVWSMIFQRKTIACSMRKVPQLVQMQDQSNTNEKRDLVILRRVKTWNSAHVTPQYANKSLIVA